VLARSSEGLNFVAEALPKILQYSPTLCTVSGSSHIGTRQDYNFTSTTSHWHSGKEHYLLHFLKFISESYKQPSRLVSILDTSIIIFKKLIEVLSKQGN
jgi:hypothetical protein